MPLYEYRCQDCGHRFEVLQSLGQGSQDLACPRCGRKAPERQYSTFAAHAGGAAAAEACTPQGCGAPACCGGFGCEN